MKVRINKLLNEAGLGSRREVESLIQSGRILLNGKRATLTDTVGVEDTVVFDGLDLPTKELVQEHLALQKVLQHEQSKQNRPKPQSKAVERAESQRLQHAAKSAALRKGRKQNPIKKSK